MQSRIIYYSLKLKNKIINQDARDTKFIKIQHPLLISPVHLYDVNKQKESYFCYFFN